MKSALSITDDPQPSHLSVGDMAKLASEHGATIYQLGASLVQIRRGSFARDFRATDDGLFRAAPIRSWLGA